MFPFTDWYNMYLYLKRWSILVVLIFRSSEHLDSNLHLHFSSLSLSNDSDSFSISHPCKCAGWFKNFIFSIEIFFLSLPLLISKRLQSLIFSFPSLQTLIHKYSQGIWLWSYSYVFNNLILISLISHKPHGNVSLELVSHIWCTNEWFLVEKDNGFDIASPL